MMFSESVERQKITGILLHVTGINGKRTGHLMTKRTVGDTGKNEDNSIREHKLDNQSL